MKKLLLAFALLLLPFQVTGQIQESTTLIFNNFALDATAALYCDTGNIPTGMSACASGTAAGDGWITVSKDRIPLVMILIDQLNVTGGLDFVIEGRINAETAVAIYSVNHTATTDSEFVRVVEEVEQIRVGISIGTSDDGDDSGANEEDITIAVYLR